MSASDPNAHHHLRSSTRRDRADFTACWLNEQNLSNSEQPFDDMFPDKLGAQEDTFKPSAQLLQLKEAADNATERLCDSSIYPPGEVTDPLTRDWVVNACTYGVSNTLQSLPCLGGVRASRSKGKRQGCCQRPHV